MKRARWRSPSPALVIACLALFVALGGTVLAATKIDGRTIKVRSLPGNRLKVGSVPGDRLKRGTIPGDRLKKGTVPGDRLRKGTIGGSRLKEGAIPGDRIAPGSLKGAQIDVATLGEVPNAAHAETADSARHARTAAAADHAADATTINGHAVGCATGRREFAGNCWDLQPSATEVDALEAAGACAARGGELPDLLALLVFDRQPGVSIEGGGEWTSSEEPAGAESWAVAVVEGGIHMYVAGPDFLGHFRCVTPLLT